MRNCWDWSPEGPKKACFNLQAEFWISLLFLQGPASMFCLLLWGLLFGGGLAPAEVQSKLLQSESQQLSPGYRWQEGLLLAAL